MAIDPIERNRRRDLVHAHMEAENAHDLEGTLATFATDGVMLFNYTAFDTLPAIQAAHEALGFGGDGGMLRDLRGVPLREYITDDEIVVQGHLTGTHVKDYNGYFPGTNSPVALPYIAIYRFDAAGKLASERVVMNLADLGRPPLDGGRVK